MFASTESPSTYAFLVVDGTVQLDEELTSQPGVSLACPVCEMWEVKGVIWLNSQTFCVLNILEPKPKRSLLSNSVFGLSSQGNIHVVEYILECICRAKIRSDESTLRYIHIL